MLNRVLILFAHPALEKSFCNRRLAEAVGELDGVTFHDLYQHYPDLDIDVEREQRLLVEHDIIIMQHPFYWYSTPAMLKEWAYGSQGTALAGKTLINVMSAGGSEKSYRREGRNRYSVREFLFPLERTAALCNMVYLPPFVVYGTHSLNEAAMQRHVSDYLRLVEALRDGTLDVDAAATQQHINTDLDAVVRKPAGA